MRAKKKQLKNLSTNSVLEIMRLHIRKQDDPILHAPTYETNEIVTNSNSNKVITGYLQQCKHVSKYLETFVKTAFGNNQSVILEGMHLSPDFI